MVKKIILILALSLLVFSGCVQSSGVLKVGPDTYTVSAYAAPVRGGESGARKSALTEANQHCFSVGKEILVSNISSSPLTHFRGGTVEVTFVCLAKDDPELQRPKFRKAPSVIIEDRRD